MSVWNNLPKSTESSSLADEVVKVDGKGITIDIYPYGAKIKLYGLKDRKLYRTFTNFFSFEYRVMAYSRKVNCYALVDGARMQFPRYGMLKYLNEVLYNVNVKYHPRQIPPPATPFKWTGALRDNQPLIANHIMKKYFTPKNAKECRAGVILKLEAGQGKTYLATRLIEKLKTKTLIVCHNTNIMEQWIKVLKNAYPNNSISRYYGVKKKCSDITVGIINSLMMPVMYIKNKKVSPKEFFKQFGYVIFDEIHMYSGKKWNKIYNRLYATYTLGLSATPDENIDFDRINEWGCGEVLDAAKLDGYTVENIPFTATVTRIGYQGHPSYTELILNDNGSISHAKMINQLCEDPYRIHLIVKLIYEMRCKRKNVFVFAGRRSYLTKIKEHMTLFKIEYKELLNKNDENEIMQLMGGSEEKDINNAITKSVVILTTYPYMGTGVSIPKMDAVILATPRKKKSRQYVGRIFRLGSNYESNREIIDIVDTGTYMKSQYYHRKAYYNEKGFPIVRRLVKWGAIGKEMLASGFAIEDRKVRSDASIELERLELLLARQ